MNYWLMKSEPDVFGLEHLKQRPNQTEHWDGVRNFQARNFLREMKRGDRAFLYHSSCAVPAIVAVMEVVREAYPDPTAFDPNSNHYDPKSKPDKPLWYMVDVKLERSLKRSVSLAELREQAALNGMRLLARGNRLSVMPVSKKEWDYILRLETQ